jgi:hypothetical protein
MEIFLFVVEISVFFVVGPLLLYALNPKFTIRTLIFIFAALAFIGLTVFHQYSLQSLGIRVDNMRAGLHFYIPITLAGLVIVFLARSHFRQFRERKQKHSIYFFYFYFFSCLVQEFIFRAYLLNRISEIWNSLFFMIVISAGLYVFMHIIFRIKGFLFYTFLFGVASVITYHFYPNLILISVSHYILGLGMLGVKVK